LFVGRRKGKKFNADPMSTGPTHDGAVNEDRVSVSWENELEIHLHAGKCRKRALDAAAFPRKVQRPANGMTLIAVGECAGKGCVKSGVLPHDHTSAPGWM
jgi:hypothetical protein